VEHVDLKAVAEWMSEQGLGEGPVEDVSDVTGGTQNVMLRFTRSAGRTCCGAGRGTCVRAATA
jgi:hypothetical protein